jgi:predicted nucleic acid-binding protein
LKASIKVETVTADDYRESVAVAEKYSVSVNDALALVVMDRHGIDEIYTFDRHFDRVPVTVVQE